MQIFEQKNLSQENRFLRVQSGLGDDVLLLRSVRGSEGFSKLFHYDIELLSDQAGIDPLSIVGDHIATFIDCSAEEPKCLNGFVSQFEFTGLEYRGLYGYRATLVPWFWFLKKRTNCRVFQNKSVPDIFEEICGEFGYQDFKLSLMEEHPKLEYCVQFRESDFDFLSRLLEREGIFYYFEQQEDKHLMWLADTPSAFSFLEKNKDIEHSSGSRATACIQAWRHQYSYLSGKWSQNDFDYEKFTHSLHTETSSKLTIKNNSQFSIYDYPGHYKESDRGKKLAQLRMEQLESGFDLITGRSSITELAVSKKFTLLSEENQVDNNKSFVISGLYHEAVDNSHNHEAGESYYANQISCLPEGAPYRPACVTPVPSIEGVQTAVVVGKSGDEIYTDSYGRIKVQFHWDMYGKKDENSSCWVRVATQWSGKKWGTLGIPRMGHEVVVTFVDGNPDRPLVIGSVYNNSSMPPYDLPGDKNVSGVKSRSTKGGDRGTYNEMSFDDTKGAEKLTIHAQRDFNMDVGKDAGTNAAGNATHNVDGDVSSTVGGNNASAISGNDTLSVSGDLSGSVGGNRSYSVGSDQSESIGSNDSISVGSNQDITIGSNQEISIGSNHTASVGANQDISVGANQTVSVSATQDITAAMQNVSISGNANLDAAQVAIAGKAKVSLSVAGSSITITPAGITLSMGASSVQINPAGVTVSGPIVKLN